MAQTGFTPIQLYSTSTAAAVPVAGNLTNSTLGSELAINITDGKLFYKDNANAVQVIGWKTVPTTAGGTGLTSYTAGDTLFYASGTTLSKLAIGTAGQILTSTGSAPQWSAPAALTEVDDTNVTMTLGGSPSTALLSAVSMTLGWTGQLATTRGGTGLSSFTANGVLYASSTSALATGPGLLFNGTQLSIATSTLSNARLTIDTAAQVGLDIFRSDVSANFSALRFRNTTNTASFGSLGFDSGGLRLDGDAGIIYFSTSGNERGRFDSSGQLLVGLTTAAVVANIQATTTGTNSNIFVRNTTATTGYFLWGNANGSDRLFCAQTGTITNATGTYGTISDAKLKENIVDATPKLNKVLQLQVKNFNIIGDDLKQIGFIAQEIEQVFPSLVEEHTGRDENDKETGEVIKSVKTSILIPILVKAIQELNAKFDAYVASHP